MLDFIKDIFSAFRQSSIERIKNPFVGAFVFSWLGFNWQVLAIILFSKKDVIERVDYIKDHYDVGHFILAPALTTIVICIILPLANKVFTKFQSKPISETTDILMQSKIDIAEKQLQIADIEAKKKLAEKREARFIEERIDATRRESEETKEKNTELINELARITHAFEKEKNESVTLRTLLNSANENVEYQKGKIIECNTVIEGLRKEINQKYNEVVRLGGEISAFEKFTKDSKEEIKNKEASIKFLYSRHSEIIRKYPELFQGDEGGIIMPKIGNESYLSELNDRLTTLRTKS